MKKKLLSAICVGIISVLMLGCGKSNNADVTTEEKVTINLGLTKAAPALPVLQMAETNAMGDNVEFNIDYWDSPEQLIAMSQDGKHDIFALPLTVGAKLYNKGIGIKLTNVDTWGITYFVTSDESIKDWSDLRGKTIYVPLKSSPPDIVLRYFLNSNGINPDSDVELKYANTSEIAQLAKAGQAEYAVLLEPQVTNCIIGNETLRIAFSYDTEWKKIMGEDKNIPNAGIGASTDFIDKNPEIMKKFEEEYEEALNYLIENPAKAGELGEKYFGVDKEIMEKAIPTLGIMYKEGRQSIEDLNEFYKVLYDFDPSTIGGKIPDEEFYHSPE